MLEVEIINAEVVKFVTWLVVEMCLNDCVRMSLKWVSCYCFFFFNKESYIYFLNIYIYKTSGDYVHFIKSNVTNARNK